MRASGKLRCRMYSVRACSFGQEVFGHEQVPVRQMFSSEVLDEPGEGARRTRPPVGCRTDPKGAHREDEEVVESFKTAAKVPQAFPADRDQAVCIFKFHHKTKCLRARLCLVTEDAAFVRG